jgi:ABC-2 type transport system ATP-binding protein
MEQTKAIETEDLTKKYGDITAVDHLNLSVEKGEIFGYLGPNGAGKSTTIRMLVGLTNPSKGKAFVEGFDINKDLVEIKRRIGVVPETSNLYNELTLWDNLLYVSRLYHVARGMREKRVHELIQFFNLEEFKGRKFGKLSKGLKRRTVLAAALVHNPSLVFLDEPTSGLDVVSARALRDLIISFKDRGITVFMTTHYIEEADRLCDRIGLLVKGKLISVEAPERLKARVQETPILETVLTPRDAIKGIHYEALSASDIHVLGEKVNIYTEDVSKTLMALHRLAEDKKFRIEEVNTIKPSLEDAFVKLTGITLETMRMDKEGMR